jgi:hypothetical protein
MSPWYCPTCQEVRGPQPGNCCPDCLGILHARTAILRPLREAENQTYDPATMPQAPTDEASYQLGYRNGLRDAEVVKRIKAVESAAPDRAHQTAAQIIREIRERVRKATAGPWAWESIAEKSNEFAVGTAFNADGQPLSGRLPEGDWVEDAVIERRGLIGMNESGHANFADADFIAHARTDIPFLLAQLETTASALSEQDEALTALKALYHELLYQVGNKYPGESRHETALRYIRQAEQPRGGPVSATKADAGATPTEEPQSESAPDSSSTVVTKGPDA